MATDIFKEKTLTSGTETKTVVGFDFYETNEEGLTNDELRKAQEEYTNQSKEWEGKDLEMTNRFLSDAKNEGNGVFTVNNKNNTEMQAHLSNKPTLEKIISKTLERKKAEKNQNELMGDLTTLSAGSTSKKAETKEVKAPMEKTYMTKEEIEDKFQKDYAVVMEQNIEKVENSTVTIMNNDREKTEATWLKENEKFIKDNVIIIEDFYKEKFKDVLSNNAKLDIYPSALTKRKLAVDSGNTKDANDIVFGEKITAQGTYTMKAEDFLRIGKSDETMKLLFKNDDLKQVKVVFDNMQQYLRISKKNK